MKIRELVKQDPGFQYVIDSMELMSSAGRRAMLDTDFLVDPGALEAEWNRTDSAIDATLDSGNRRAYNDLRHCLMQLHDLQGTLAALASHTTLNEVELFEIKNLALLAGKASSAIASLGLAEALPMPVVADVFALPYEPCQLEAMAALLPLPAPVDMRFQRVLLCSGPIANAAPFPVPDGGKGG